MEILRPTVIVVLLVLHCVEDLFSMHLDMAPILCIQKVSPFWGDKAQLKVPAGLLTVSFLENVNKFQNPFRRPVATTVFLIGPSSSDRVIKTRSMDTILGVQELEIPEIADSMEQCHEHYSSPGATDTIRSEFQQEFSAWLDVANKVTQEVSIGKNPSPPILRSNIVQNLDMINVNSDGSPMAVLDVVAFVDAFCSSSRYIIDFLVLTNNTIQNSSNSINTWTLSTFERFATTLGSMFSDLSTEFHFVGTEPDSTFKRAKSVNPCVLCILKPLTTQDF
ncbi:hypothetical protein G4B88_009886 [Cannabis sativa]|uniref:Uncharacterized protein n=1 Tax=Cannabis sativa TaxID=3483 RepID=A0A7J6HH62_CANSA|nr:hypothetical protein G4B88_009886 [Cannabis sativa]